VPAQISGILLEGLGRIPKNADHSYQYLLMRLLLGTAKISRGRIRGKQAVDYSSLPAIFQTKTPANAVKDFLMSYSIGGSVERFIKLTLGDNREFYKEILSEFLNFKYKPCKVVILVPLFFFIEYWSEFLTPFRYFMHLPRVTTGEHLRI